MATESRRGCIETDIKVKFFTDTRMLEGCGRVVKYSLFVANLVIMLGGIVVFSVGVWTLADR